jgi:minor curlin subunit
MKARLFFLLAGLGGALAAQGQAGGTSQAATAEQRLAEDLGVDRLRNALLPTTDTRNAALLLQNGLSNSATINQLSQGLPLNQATIVQAGTGNTLGLDQVGAGNQTSFSQAGDANQAALRQNGATNTITGRVTGNNNSVEVEQQGFGNQYSTQLTGNQGRYTIEQLGNNNSLTQRETSAATPLPGYEVKMEGSNMRLTIEQGKVFP